MEQIEHNYYAFTKVVGIFEENSGFEEIQPFHSVISQVYVLFF